MNSKALVLKRGLSVILLGMLLLIGGCSSGSDSSSGTTTTPTPSTLSGTAATGAPIVGVVYVKDASGMEVNVVIDIDALGSFSVDVTGMTAPFLLRALPDNTALPAQFSFAAAGGSTVNISQLTSLAIQTALGSGGLTALYSGWDGTQVDNAGILVAQAIVNANFTSQFSGQGVDAATYSFFDTVFTADGTGIDGVLDALTVVIDLDMGTVSVSDTSGALTFDISIDTSGITGGTGGGGTGTAGQWNLVINITSPAAVTVNVGNFPAAPALADVASALDGQAVGATNVSIVSAVDTATRKEFTVTYTLSVSGFDLNYSATYVYTLVS